MARYHSEDSIEKSRQRDTLPITKQIEQQKVTLAEKEQQVAQSALNGRMEAGIILVRLKWRSVKVEQAKRTAK